MKILAIDDHADNLTALKAVVTDALPGTTVLTALNGPRGIELARAEDPDVILLDIVMPDMDGFAVCRKLKADARLQPIPVVFLTALKTSRASRIQALDAGGEAFLSKPLDEEELVAQIRAMIKVKAANKLQRLEKEQLAALVAERTQDLERELAERKRAEETAKKSELEYRRLFENSMMGISEATAEGRLLRANLAYAKMYGYDTPEQMMAEVADVGHQLYANPEDRKDVLRILDEKGFMEPREFPVLRRDGTPMFVMASARRIQDASGRLLCYQATHMDISERKRAEQAMRESEERFRSLVKLAPIPMCFVNKDGVLTYLNDRFVQLFGYAAAEVPTTKEWGERAYPDEKYRRWAIARWEAAVAKAVRDGLDIGPLEYNVTCRDGTVRVIEISGIVMGGSLLATFFDFTERKRAAEEHERLLAAIEQSGEIIFITDTDGVIQYVNPAFEAMTGYTRHEAVGQTPRLLRSGRHTRDFYREMWATIASGKTWQGRIVNKRKDGTFYTESAAISPVRDAAGRIVNYVAVNRDITEHLQLEAQLQQAQKMELVGRLAGGVAHDYNNMLSVILGYTELALAAVDPDQPVWEDLKEVQKAARRSSDITRQLLAFARRQTITPKELDLSGTVEGMLKMLRHLIGENVDLTWRPGNEPTPVKMDPSQIDQILANLAVNARDAIGGVGKLTIATGTAVLDEAYCAVHAGTAPGDYVMLAVSDNGCGMSRDVFEHLFEPFFTTKEVGKGTGLGLATVYGIVKQNNGSIDVYSEPGKGTTFKIYLPRHVPGGGPAPATEEAAPPAAPRGTETVLVVEDEPAVRTTVQRFLEALGYAVLVAPSPEEALRLVPAHSGPIHLLMADVVMPGMSGRDLAKRLTEQRPEMRCLFMSGYTADVIAHHGILDEGVNFIGKPFTRDELARKVRATLEQK